MSAAVQPEPCLRAYMIRMPDAGVVRRSNDSIASTRREAEEAYRALRGRDWIIADHYLAQKDTVEGYWGFVLVYHYPISDVPI